MIVNAPAPTTLEVPAHCQMFLAFDFGLKRTGVATGNRLTRSATPQPTIAAEGDAQVAQTLAALAQQAVRIGEMGDALHQVLGVERGVLEHGGQKCKKDGADAAQSQ